MTAPGDDPTEPPIEAMRDFAFPADPAFVELVRRRIDRRETAGELVRLSTGAVLAIVIEFLSLFKGPPDHPEPPLDPNVPPQDEE